MRSSLDVLEKEIDEVRILAQSIKPANDFLSTSSDQVVKAYLVVRRRFDYAALVVALYASFEQFVEDILASYITVISRQTDYAALPSKLIQKNLRKTGEILWKGDLDQSRYNGITQLQLIENLYGCLAGTDSYTINQAAIASHDRNINFGELGGLLSLAGIAHDHVCRTDAILEWFCSEQGLSEKSSDAVPTSVIKTRLDDLVERRNDIAHRGGNPANRLGPEDMLGATHFVLALARSILTLFVSEYLLRIYVQKGTSVKLDLLEGPFQKQTIWVVKPPECHLYEHQPIFALSPTGFVARWGRIQILKVEDVRRDDIKPASGAASIGIQLDFAAPKNSQLYVLTREDSLIWPQMV